jgi:hypothetical protein
MSRAVPRFRRSNPSLPAAVPNLFEVVVQGTIDSQMTINTFYFADGGAALIANSEFNIGAGWVAAFGTLFRASVSSDWSSLLVKVQCLTTPTRIPGVTSWITSGTGPAGHAPTTVCVTCYRGSNVKGQAGRGRFSLPAVPLSWLTSSAINATGVTALNATVTSLGTGFTASGVTYVQQIVSRKNKNGPVLGAAPLLTQGYRTLTGTCRRRKIGRGK